MNSKRIAMFTWVTEEELSWLLILDELEEYKEELGFEFLAEGLDMLLENMNLEEFHTRNKALLGLCEEGFITMDMEDNDGEITIYNLSITQRGRKLLAESMAISEEKRIAEKENTVEEGSTAEEKESTEECASEEKNNTVSNNNEEKTEIRKTVWDIIKENVLPIAKDVLACLYYVKVIVG